MSANNQRLFRTAWSILRNRAEAEEAVQAAYVAAFSRIGSFEGRSALSSWLTRILVKPSHIIGGYAQLSYFFNYIGPTGNNRDEVTMIRKRTAPVEY